LSDLHFGAGNIAHRFDQKAVARSILRDIETNGPKNPNFVFVTGDIAYSAKPAQYKDAGLWFDQIAKMLNMERERIRLVPGNHDIDRSKAAKLLVSDIHARVRSNPEDLDERLSDEDARKQLALKLEAYAAFAKKFGVATRRRGQLDIDWTESQRIEPYGYPIRLIGLSSVWCSDASDGRESAHASEPFVPNMVLGPGQIRSKIDETTDEELLFLLTHHPPEWYHRVSVETLASALSRKTHIHLCGHVHDASARAVKRFGASLRSVRCVAGAAHGSPSEKDHGYSWGALRWNSLRARWEVGWAPRVYRADPEGMYQMSYPLDAQGYAWEEIDLAWANPNPPHALPHTPSSSMR
jgi:calcineurin-like phosphoesterase family protein